MFHSGLTLRRPICHDRGVLKIVPIPAFNDNYIWCLHDGAHAAFVDPGDAKPVFETVEREQLKPAAIIVTHHHWDHVGGIAELRAQWNVPVFGPAAERIPNRTHALAEGDTITVPGIDLDLSVMEVPGHTSGHIAYVGDDILLCGDTLFSVGCGRLFEGTPEEMWDSLKKLRELPEATGVYCTHEYTQANCAFALRVEPENAALVERTRDVERLRRAGQPTLPSTIGLEKATNPFLRSDTETVTRIASTHAGRDVKDPADVFAVIRAWKDAC